MKIQMMKLASSLVFAVIVGGCTTGKITPAPELAVPGAFTLGSFNVRCPAATDTGDKAWYRRLPEVAKVIRGRDIGVFGVQELTPEGEAIFNLELPGYRHVGCGRDKNRRGEAMMIYFATNRFECLESGTFWLSMTPDEPGSKYPGAGCPRTCTWAKLRDRTTDKRFTYFNTHLDHVSAKARCDGLGVLLARGIKPALARGEAVLLSGDFNECLDKEDTAESMKTMIGAKLSEAAKTNPIALMSTELIDTIVASENPHRGTFRTYNGYNITPKARIDYIFASSDVRVLSHETINDRPNGKLISDHYPVAVTVLLK